MTIMENRKGHIGSAPNVPMSKPHMNPVVTRMLAEGHPLRHTPSYSQRASSALCSLGNAVKEKLHGIIHGVRIPAAVMGQEDRPQWGPIQEMKERGLL